MENEKVSVKEKNIHLERVPGTYELAVGARLIMANSKVDAVICLGCVIKGETNHNEYINHATANALNMLSVQSAIPCIFGVLTPNTIEQARDRAGGRHGNKGVEAAVTALHMAQLRRSRSRQDKNIGFNKRK